MSKNAIRILVVIAFACGCSQAPPPPSVGLEDAAYQGNLEAMRQHIKAGSDLDQRSPEGGSSPLIIAITLGHAEVAKATRYSELR